MGMNRPRQLRRARSRWPVMAGMAVAAASLSWGLPPTSQTALAQTAPTTAPEPLPAPSSSWAIIPSPDMTSSRGDYLTSVSCTPGPACMAVGRFFGPGEKTMAESWGGSAWSAVPTPDAGDTTNVLISNVLNAVSCISAQACTAVGEYVAPGAWQTLIEAWDGSTWSIVPSPNVSPSLGNYLDGVSCLSATFCTAVGSFITKQGDKTLVESWDGSTWSIVPSPDTGYIDGLLSVSCTSASACTAVGDSRPRFGFDRTLAETWDGKAWSVVPSPDASTSTNVLDGVSCPTAAQCVAVGTFFNGSEFQLLSMSWDGTSWSLLPNPGLHADGTGVTCSSATNCTEVGASGLVNTWDGKTWALVPTPAAPGPTHRLNAISCVPGSVCMAVGDYTEGTVAQTLVEEGCGLGGPVAEGPSTGRLSADATYPGPVCPLDVAVKVLEPLRSGLAVHSQPYALYPVDFAASKAGTDAYRCESGCVDVVVTVTNPRTHKKVEGAVVNATLSELALTEARGPITTLTPIVGGAQYLCASDMHGIANIGCGLFLAGKSDELLHTDPSGHVYLRYWAPGVLRSVNTTLNITARVTCSARACPSREMTGSAKAKLTVSPDLIYTHSAPLSKDQVTELVAWATGGGVFKKFLTSATRANTAAKYTLKWLKAQELASEKVVEGLEKVEKAEPVLLAIDAVNVLSDIGERQLNLAEFLYVTDLDAVGLGRDPFESSVPATPELTFSNKVVNFGVAVPGEIGAAGAWWETAKKLAEMQDSGSYISTGGKSHKVDMSDWGIKLDVYEVSHCDPDGYCVPGYAQNGIKPELYFDVILTYNGEAYDYWDFTVAYDAIAWTETQWNLRNLIHDAR